MNCYIAIFKSDIKEVSSIAVIKDGKILMGKRRDNDLYTLPGGHLDKDEAPLDGAQRELLEETGMEVDKKDLKHLKSKTIKTFTGKTMTIHAYKYEWDGEKTTVKNDPDKEVFKWEWIDFETNKEVRENLHSPKNVTLSALGLMKGGFMDDILKGGQGSGQKGHHSNLKLMGERGSHFYVDPKEADKEKKRMDRIKQREAEMWAKLMKERGMSEKSEKYFSLVIDLEKAMPGTRAGSHKYLRKHMQNGKWVYIYYDAKGKNPKQLDDEKAQIIHRMAELGHAGAKKALENAEDHTTKIGDLHAKAKHHEDEGTRSKAKKKLMKEYGIDHDAKELKSRLAMEPMDKVDENLPDADKEALLNEIKSNIGKMRERFRQNASSSLATKAAAVTDEQLLNKLDSKNTIKDVMNQLNQNLIHLDVAHEGESTPQYDWAKKHGTYSHAIYNETLKHIEQKIGVEGFAEVNDRKTDRAYRPNEFLIPASKVQEKMEEKRRQAEEERKRQEEEERREMAGIQNTMAYHIVTSMDGGRMSAAEKKETAKKLNKAIKNIFGKALTKEEWPYHFEGTGLTTKIKSVGSIGENSFDLSLQVYNRDGEPLMERWERQFSKSSDGRPKIYNAFMKVAASKRDGTQIGNHINKGQRKLMKSIPGGGTIAVTANITVGGYTWANQGFSFKEEEQKVRYQQEFKTFVSRFGVGLTEEDVNKFQEPFHFAMFSDGKKYLHLSEDSLPLSEAQKTSGSLLGYAGDEKFKLTDEEIAEGKSKRSAVDLGKKFLLGRNWSGVWDSEKDTAASRYGEAYSAHRDRAKEAIDQTFKDMIGAVKRGERAATAEPERESPSRPGPGSSTYRSESRIRMWTNTNRRTGRSSLRMTKQRVESISRWADADFEHFLRHAPITRAARTALRTRRAGRTS